MSVDEVELKTRARGDRGRSEGVVLRHARSCEIARGGRCSCAPSFQAQVWSPRDRKTIRKTFTTITEAKAWRRESQVALRKGTLRAPSPTSLAEAAREWLEAAQAGVVRTRSGDAYKPSALRSYRQALDTKVLPMLGQLRLAAVTTPMLQNIADRLAADGLSASTIRNSLLPLRAIYRRAHNRGEVAVNPTLKLALPTVRGRRDHVGRASDDAIRSLVISYKLLGTREWFVIYHSDCGMEFFTDEVMRDLLVQSLETAELGPDGFRDVGSGPGSTEAKYVDSLTISNREQSVVEDVRRIRGHPLVPTRIPIYGYIYDVETGRLIEVIEATQAGRPS